MMRYLMLAALVAFTIGLMIGLCFADKTTVLDFSEMTCPMCGTPLELIVDSEV